MARIARIRRTVADAPDPELLSGRTSQALSFARAVSVAIAQTNLASFSQRLRATFANVPASVRIFESSVESRGSVTGFVCDERGLRQ